MVVVSEVLNQSPAMVQNILGKVTELIKRVCPLAKFIHYWTYSPTSQERNKTLFDIVARHMQLFD
jgi:hypothetical protein